MPATIIDHTDVGAPVLSGLDTNNAMYNVLKWALPQLGWTIAFDNGTNKIVFRNSVADGSGSYLRILDGTSSSLDVRMYSAMSDIDTGTNQTLNITTSRWSKSANADNNARAWRIIGDKQRFWICISASNDNFVTPIAAAAPQLAYFAGDIISRSPMTNEAMLIAEANASSVMLTGFDWTGSGVIPSMSNESHQFVLALDGVSKGNFCRIFAALVSNLSTSAGIGTAGVWEDPVTGDVNINYAWLSDGAVVRGRLPGVFIADGDVFTAASLLQFASFPSALTPEGELDLIAILSNVSRASAARAMGVLLAVDSEDWVGVS